MKYSQTHVIVKESQTGLAHRRPLEQRRTSGGTAGITAFPTPSNILPEIISVVCGVMRLDAVERSGHPLLYLLRRIHRSASSQDFVREAWFSGLADSLHHSRRVGGQIDLPQRRMAAQQLLELSARPDHVIQAGHVVVQVPALLLRVFHFERIMTG